MPRQIIDNVLSDARYYLSLPSALQELVRASYLHSFQLVPRMFSFSFCAHLHSSYCPHSRLRSLYPRLSIE